MIAITITVMLLIGCSDDVHYVIPYTEGSKKVVVILIVNGCTNRDSRKIEDVFKDLLSSGKFVYHNENDAVFFSTFSNLVEEHHLAEQNLHCKLSPPYINLKTNELFKKLKLHIKKSLPDIPQKDQHIPALSYYVVQQIVNQHGDFIKKHNFNQLEIISISSYQNLPTSATWESERITAKYGAKLYPALVSFVKKPQTPFGFLIQDTFINRGYSSQLIRFIAAPSKAILSKKYLTKTLSSFLSFERINDTFAVCITNQKTTDSLQIISILNLKDKHSDSLPITRSNSCWKTSLSIPPWKYSYPIFFTALIKINTVDPILGNHQLLLKTLPLEYNAGVGFVGLVKYVANFFLKIMFYIIIAALIIILFKHKSTRNNIGLLKVLIIILFRKIWSFVKAKSIFALEKLLSLVNSNYQTYIVLIDSLNNKYIFNYNLLQRNYLYIKYFLCPNNGYLHQLTDSSAHSVIKSNDSIKLSDFPSNLTLNLIWKGKKASLPPLSALSIYSQSVHRKPCIVKLSETNPSCYVNNEVRIKLEIKHISTLVPKEETDRRIDIRLKPALHTALLAHLIENPKLPKSILFLHVEKEHFCIGHLDPSIKPKGTFNPFSYSIKAMLCFRTPSKRFQMLGFLLKLFHLFWVYRTTRIVISSFERNGFIEKLNQLLQSKVLAKLVNSKFVEANFSSDEVLSIHKAFSSCYVHARHTYIPFLYTSVRNPFKDTFQTKLLDDKMRFISPFNFVTSLTPYPFGFINDCKTHCRDKVSDFEIQPEAERIESTKHPESINIQTLTL